MVDQKHDFVPRTETSRFWYPSSPLWGPSPARDLLRLTRVGLNSLPLALVVAGGLIHFFVLSFDELGWLREEATLYLPMIRGKPPILDGEDRLLAPWDSKPVDGSKPTTTGSCCPKSCLQWIII